jgi:hypothetical protein
MKPYLLPPWMQRGRRSIGVGEEQGACFWEKEGPGVRAAGTWVTHSLQRAGGVVTGSLDRGRSWIWISADEKCRSTRPGQ